MPDFLSRLVERAYGLMPVARPVIGSVFAPMPARESDYIQDLASDSEQVSNQESIYIESAPETGIKSQHNGQPTQKKSLNKIPDNQHVPVQYVESGSRDKDGAKHSYQIEGRGSPEDLTSISRLPHNIELLNQNGIPELAHDKGLLHQVDSDTSGYVKYEKQFHSPGPDSQVHVEPEHKDFADARENRKTISMMNPIFDKEPPQNPETGSLEVSKPSHPVGIQKNRNNNRTNITRYPELPYENNITRYPELPYENLSAGKHPGSKNTGETWQNEPLIDIEDNPVAKTLIGHISDSSLLHESFSSMKNGGDILQNSEPASGTDFYRADYPHLDTPSLIASRQNPDRMNKPNVNATLEQKGNMLIDQHAVAPRPPSTVPIVKVTIGRIEVKAVTPPQAPQLQSPPPKQRPILSLDDYLKQYNG